MKMNTELFDQFMHGFTRRMEFDDMVRQWCRSNRGCSDVPCSCRRKFVLPNFKGDAELRLVSIQAKREPVKLTLVWSR